MISHVKKFKTKIEPTKKKNKKSPERYIKFIGPNIPNVKSFTKFVFRPETVQFRMILILLFTKFSLEVISMEKVLFQCVFLLFVFILFVLIISGLLRPFGLYSFFSHVDVMFTLTK